MAIHRVTSTNRVWWTLVPQRGLRSSRLYNRPAGASMARISSEGLALCGLTLYHYYLTGSIGLAASSESTLDGLFARPLGYGAEQHNLRMWSFSNADFTSQLLFLQS